MKRQIYFSLFLLKFVMFFGFLFIMVTSNAQTEKKGSFALTATFPFLSAQSVGIQPGFAYNFNNSWQVITEIGVPLKRTTESDFEKFALLRVQTEVKYFGKNFRYKNSYVSLQAGYLFRNLANNDSGVYFHKQTYREKIIVYSSATATSPVLFSALKIGIENQLLKKYFLDWSFGIGVRSVKTSYKAMSKQERDIQARGFGFGNTWNVEGTFIRLHGVICLRLVKYF